MIDRPIDSGGKGGPRKAPGRPTPGGKHAGVEHPDGPDRDADNEPGGVRIRDSRRIDPKTYEVRPGGRSAPRGAPSPDRAPSGADAGGLDVDGRVAELTADLQRLSAEYANYRKRVDRDRDLQRELAIASVMVDLLPILDDVGRAREHGELDGGFKAVAEAVANLTAKHGVVAFGSEGEPFDPKFHEAMTSETREDLTEPTVVKVYQVGYRIGDRVLRPARVGVADTG